MNDIKKCIDFECRRLNEDKCIAEDKIYNPCIKFSCSDCELKQCIFCTRREVCINPERR